MKILKEILLILYAASFKYIFLFRFEHTEMKPTEETAAGKPQGKPLGWPEYAAAGGGTDQWCTANKFNLTVTTLNEQ